MSAEDAAKAGEVWQEADGVLLLCVKPGETWGDFRGDRFAWDAPTIARPLHLLLDSEGNLAPHIKAEAWSEGAEATAEWMANNPGPSGIPHDPPRNPYDPGTMR